MLPLLLPMWQTDATLRGALTESAQTTLAGQGSGALLTGAEVGADVQAIDAMATYGIRAHAQYARLIDLTYHTAQTLPSNAVSGELAADGGWQLSPRSRFTLDTRGFLANHFGVRATDILAARDPLTVGDRLEYATGGGFTFATTPTQRTTFHVTGGYMQAGALTAVAPDPVGVDTHTARGVAAYGYDITRSDTLTPELRYAYTHYYHALSSAQLTFVPADIHAGTAMLGESHAFSGSLAGTIAGGVTVATPSPIVASRSPVMSPEAYVALSYVSNRYRATAGYAYTYTSLGPRIGYGAQHNATFEVVFRPASGARWRDLLFHAIGHFANGSAPILKSATSDATGTVTTTTATAGALLEYPIARGFSVFSGIDLQLLNAAFNPPVATGFHGAQLLALATLGIAGTLSTDPLRRVHGDVDVDDVEARARIRGDVAPDQRPLDRSREDREREGERINDNDIDNTEGSDTIRETAPEPWQ